MLDNATYIFDHNWEQVSRMTKAQILQGDLHLDRIIHAGNWTERIEGFAPIILTHCEPCSSWKPRNPDRVIVLVRGDSPEAVARIIWELFFRRNAFR